MTLELVELGPTNFDLLDAIERTPEPTEEWVREVVHHPLVGYLGSEYISAVLLDHRSRGQGHGRPLIGAVAQHAIDARGR